MPRYQRKRSSTGFYHAMLRGNERKNIFLDDEDMLYWLETLSRIKERGKFYLQAFCLVDNHLHLMFCRKVLRTWLP